MKAEEIWILALTGTAAYLVWRTRSRKPAMVTQSMAGPVTQSPASSAIVPVGSQQPTMPTMRMPSLPDSVIQDPPPTPPEPTSRKSMCIPVDQLNPVPPCPEGQYRIMGPCTWPGGPRFVQRQPCPTGYKYDMNVFPCGEKCTGKPPPGLTEDLVKTFQSEYRIGPDEPGNTLPRCVPAGTNIVVDPCPPGQHRACHRMAWKCPEGQKIVAASSCGKCHTPTDPNRRVPYAEERRKKNCLQSNGVWNAATRKCERRK